MNSVYASVGILCGVVASVIWQEYAAPWLRKRKQYKQRVATRKAKVNKKLFKEGVQNENE